MLDPLLGRGLSEVVHEVSPEGRKPGNLSGLAIPTCVLTKRAIAILFHHDASSQLGD
ncbi:MAG: hypothetical protein F6K04_05415 [Leptolyngbya sp. SIO4C5]|nr:hypothetical protein [Leptolyngbya sp. SIO4C5]